MTLQQENILTRQIKGLTWGVVLSIAATFGGGAVFIVRNEIKTQVALGIATSKLEEVKESQQELKNDIRNVNNRVDIVEARQFSVKLTP